MVSCPHVELAECPRFGGWVFGEGLDGQARCSIHIILKKGRRQPERVKMLELKQATFNHSVCKGVVRLRSEPSFAHFNRYEMDLVVMTNCAKSISMCF